MTTTENILALLNLPPASVLTLDGEQVVLKRNDFVGFANLPLSFGDGDNPFHLVTIRAGKTNKANHNNNNNNHHPTQQVAGVTVGFVFSPEHPMNHGDNNLDCYLIRRYDPHTEEVSSDNLDDWTISNLLNQVRQNQIDKQRLVDYRQFLSGSKALAWKSQSNFISKRLLQRRGIASGDKIVPGSYGYDDARTTTRTCIDNNGYRKDAAEQQVDGRAVCYPHIPVIGVSQHIHVHSSQHLGTKQFLARLSPRTRTDLFMDRHPADRALETVLKQYFDNKLEDLLGDVQLSYCLFLYLHCFASLSHWRDTVAMLSLVSTEAMYERIDLYRSLLNVLVAQLSTMEQDFFQDVELSGGNFLVPALERLLNTMSTIKDDSVKDSFINFRNQLSNRLCIHGANESDDTYPIAERKEDTLVEPSDTEDDEDGPVIVPMDEVEASRARENGGPTSERNQTVANIPAEIKQRYPLLVAAVSPTEDIVMTCARVLDEANDVSLVREAADYLEHIEASKVS